MNNSNDAEQAVIGGLLIDNGAWETVSDKLTVDDFFHHHHRVMFSAIAELLNQNISVDMLTLCDVLKRKDKLQEVDELYVFEVGKNTPSIANIEHYAGIVKRYSIERQVLNAAHRIAKLAEDNVDDCLAEAQKIMMSINESKTSSPICATDILRNVIDDIHTRFESKSLGGLSSGYDAVDAMTHGLQKSDLIILAARPGMGKTTFAMNIAEQVAVIDKKPALVFSLEMSKEQLMQRLIASCGRVNFEIIRSAKAEAEEFGTKIPMAIARISESKLLIDDSPGLTVADIRARALRVKREHGLALIIVDYLQLIHSTGKVESETLRITQISAALKQLAKELGVPVIALSQLNRSVESRADKKPVMSDLRQSGAIEQDADLIMFLYREEVYNKETPNKGMAEVIIAKHRNGETGSINLIFEGRYCRFDNFDGRVIQFEQKSSKKWGGGFEY